MNSTYDTRIINQFISAVMNNNRVQFESLLDENDGFEMQDKYFETITGKKKEFSNWFFSQLQNTIVTNVKLESCIHSVPGNVVIIFNNGKFPRTIKDDTEKSKTGLLIEIHDGKINRIRFCFSFLRTENKSVLDIKIEKAKIFKDFGLTMDDAIGLITRRSPIEDFNRTNWN